MPMLAMSALTRVFFAPVLALRIIGSRMPASSAITRMTTINSISVKPRRGVATRRPRRREPALLDRAEIGDVVVGSIDTVLAGADQDVRVLLPRDEHVVRGTPGAVGARI